MGCDAIVWPAGVYLMRAPWFSGLILAGLAAVSLSAGHDAAIAQAEVEVPYWASVQKDEAFARAGPMATYPIDWVFRRKHPPGRSVEPRGGQEC